MKNIKLLLISILSWSLVFPSSIYAEVPMPSDDMKSMVKIYNEQLSNVGSLISFLEKNNQSKNAEMIKKENLSSDFKLPRFVMMKNVIGVNEQGKKIILIPLNDGSINVAYMGKVLSFNKSMTAQEVKINLEKLLVNSHSYSLVDLFINEADALVPGMEIVAVMFVGLIAALSLTSLYFNNRALKDGGELGKKIDSLQVMCEDLTGDGPFTNGIQSNIKAGIDQLKKAKKECEANKVNPAVCKKLKKTLGCLEELLYSASPNINNQPRNNSKEVEKDNSTSVKSGHAALGK